MNENTEASAIFAPLWRRKWLILAVAIVAGIGSYLYYRREPQKYLATTQVYLDNGAEEASHIGSGSGSGASSGKKSVTGQPATQAALINSSIIRDAVKARLRKQRKTPAVRAALKGKTKTKAGQKSVFLTISGEARSGRGVALLVNLTAQTYVKRQNQRYRRQVLSAIALARRQARKIEVGQIERASAKGKGGKATTNATATLQAATLANKINQLESDLTISQVAQVDPATRKSAKLTGPHPKSNAIFGFVVGLLLASFAAYALGRLDRRMRSLAVIEAAFRTQILTALPAVRRPIVRRDGHAAPAKTLREALWRLQTTLQVGAARAPAAPEHNGAGARNGGPRVILCTSADPGDGKSTLVAALALAQSEAGRRVAVVEADLRRPVLAKLLGVDARQGLADVLAGRLTLEEAIQHAGFARAGAGPAEAPGGGTATMVQTAGATALLAGSPGVANPPALLSSPTMAELLRELAGEYDYVLLDAPGPLQVSDAMPLLGLVDGIVLLARVAHTREPSAGRLLQLLEHTPSAPVLGVVVNGVSQKDIRRYGLSERYQRGWRHRLLGR